MNLDTTHKPPIWFWIVAIIGLIWNGMGVNAYLQQAFNTESFRNMYSEEQLNIVASTPVWVTAAFAVAVFSGFFAFVFMLLRKKLSYTLMLISLFAVLVQMSYLLINGYTSSMVMTIMIIVFAIIFVLLARYFSKKGWIK
ncbi:hypothetical protein [Lacinutrix chionoecetis]